MTGSRRRRDAAGVGDLSSLERCPFLLGNPQDIDGRIGDMLFRRAGFAPVAAGREPHTRSASALSLIHI